MRKQSYRSMMKRFFCLSLLTITVAGCSFFSGSKPESAPLPGQRISIMELQKSLEVDTDIPIENAIRLPAPWQNAFWPQSGGYPNHAMQNPRLSRENLKRVWSANIGDGATKAFPLNARPIAVDGRVFALDTDHKITALSMETGDRLWRADIGSEFEKDPVIAGGIAFGEGFIFATSGYNEVLALAADTGEIKWRQSIPAPSRAAPTIIDGRVFVATLDNRLFAMSVVDGTIIWEFAGLSEMTGLIGAASAAASNDIVIPAFSSGEINALRVQNGAVAWSDNLTSRQRFGGLNSISDIKAMPVIDNGTVFAVSFSGKLVAIDQRTGTRIWQRDIGGSNLPWVAGNTVFILSSENELTALNRENGAIYWVQTLPAYSNPEKRKGVLTWMGPILAGNRLILTTTSGIVFEVDPENGETIKQWNTKHSIAHPPIIASDTMILLNNKGRIVAYK